MTAALEQFRSALEQRGIIADNIIADGQLHRADVDAKNGRQDAAYIFHLDAVPAGGFENHRDGLGWENWKADVGRSLSSVELEAQRAKIKADKRQTAADREARRAQARTKAAAVWEAATAAERDHPYLLRKGVAPVPTLRELPASALYSLLGYAPQASGERLTGRVLVVPVGVPGELHTLEMIDEDGRKTALAGGAKSGHYWTTHRLPDGDGAGKTIAIAEGVATALSVYHATGHTTIAALSCINLAPVTKALRERSPLATLIVCGDLGNGHANAEQAAREAGALMVLPDFAGDPPDGATDFNDMMRLRGAEAVKEAVANAKAPVVQIHPAPNSIAAAAILSSPPKSTTTNAGDWPDPAPLVAPLPPVQPFNELLLPASLRAWIMDAAERMQCPPDYQAVAAMVSLGAVVGRKVGIRPKLHDDWLEVPNLWGLIVGPPGVMKTPALREGMAPLRKLEAKASEIYQTEREAWERDAELHKIKQNAKKGELFKAASKGSNIVADELLGDYAEPEPHPKRYQINDTSTEALGEILRYNPNGVLANRDEISGLLKALDKEGNEGMRAFYLSAWTGREPYVFDRIARGFNLRIEACCLSLLGTIQPALIGEHLRQAMATAGGDGLVPRFQLLVYPDIAADWRDVDREPDGFAKQDAYAVYERLNAFTPEAIGADLGDIPYLRFEAGARERFAEWHGELERRLRGGDEHPAMVAHLAKYPGLAAKLALLSQLADDKSGPIDVESTERALGWIEYLETHVARAYRSVAQAQMASAAALLHRIRKRDVEPQFRARDVYQKAWAHLATAEHTAQAIRILVDYDYLRAEEKDTGGRPTTIYTVNPKAMT